MKGYPLHDILLVFAFFGLLALPLTHLTRARHNPQPAEPTAAATDAPTTTNVDTWITLRFAHPPTRVTLRANEQLLLQATSPKSTIEQSVQLPLHDGQLAELHLDITWPPTTPETASEIILEPDSRETRRATAWGHQHLNQVLTFSWPQP